MPKYQLRTLLTIFIVVAIAFAIVVPAVRQVKEAERRVRCHNQLRQTGLAMINYESGRGHLPIGIKEFPAGTPFLSWRALIKPYLEQAQQFYDPKFAWDSQKNARLFNGTPVTATDKGGGNPRAVVLDPCPHYFWSCPSDIRNQVNYAVVVGEETAFPLNRAVSFDEITDGLANTILIVETLSGSTIWTEPKDIRFDSMKFVIGNSANGELASKHPAGVNVCFGDGMTYTIDAGISPKELRALFTISGGESVTRKDLIDRGIIR